MFYERPNCSIFDGHINPSSVRNMYLGQCLSSRLRLLTERSGWQVILLFFEELGGISIPVVLTSAIAGQSMTFFSKAAIFYSKALKPVLIRISILSSLLRMASKISVWFPSTIWSELFTHLSCAMTDDWSVVFNFSWSSVSFVKTRWNCEGLGFLIRELGIP